MFRIIEDLVLWENTTNKTVLQQARDEIWQIWRYTYAENADHPRAKELFALKAEVDPTYKGGRPHWRPSGSGWRAMLPI